MADVIGGGGWKYVRKKGKAEYIKVKTGTTMTPPKKEDKVELKNKGTAEVGGCWQKLR